MKSLQEVLSLVTKTFSAHGISNSRSQAEELLCDLLHCSRADLYQWRLRSLNVEEWEKAQAWVQRRLKGEPLAYISGHVQFYGCSLAITPAVLIPRPETEILVDKIAQSLQKQDLQGKILWDLCSGSGCIGIALKKRFPLLSIVLADQSADAMAIASRNAAANAAEVEYVLGDLLNPFEGRKAHYVVCNPPYISEEEYATLSHEVKDYEPRPALVGGKSGLEIYERLAAELPAYLYPHAQVWLEIGYQQGEAIQGLFSASPWKRQLLENDWAGHHRFFFLENE